MKRSIMRLTSSCSSLSEPAELTLIDSEVLLLAALTLPSGESVSASVSISAYDELFDMAHWST